MTKWTGSGQDGLTRQHPHSYPINAEWRHEWLEMWPTTDLGDPELELDYCWEKIAQLTTALQIERERIAHLKQFKEWSK